jgi:hypothetical protein
MQEQGIRHGQKTMLRLRRGAVGIHAAGARRYNPMPEVLSGQPQGGGVLYGIGLQKQIPPARIMRSAHYAIER